MAHTTDSSNPVTPGERLFRIRLACGDGVRKAEPMTDFVERVERKTGEKYHATTVSLLERNQQKWRLDDVKAFAAVDPLERGEIWLSALSATSSLPAPAPDTRPVHERTAEAYGLEVGIVDLPDNKRAPAKKASAGRKRPKG